MYHEKLPRGTEVIRAFEALGDYVGRRPTHTTSIEAGGLNSTTPFVVAAQLGIPLVDADGMGRAFPEIQMIIATSQYVAPPERSARCLEIINHVAPITIEKGMNDSLVIAPNTPMMGSIAHRR